MSHNRPLFLNIFSQHALLLSYSNLVQKCFVRIGKKNASSPKWSVNSAAAVKFEDVDEL